MIGTRTIESKNCASCEIGGWLSCDEEGIEGEKNEGFYEVFFMCDCEREEDVARLSKSKSW